MIPEIISAIANALMAIAAILGLGFTAYSVYQASKNIESATRPVITPYIELVNSDPGAYYFIIKNFGASSARITGFKTELRGLTTICPSSNSSPYIVPTIHSKTLSAQNFHQDTSFILHLPYSPSKEPPQTHSSADMIKALSL